MRRNPRLTITAPNRAARRVIAPYVKIIRKRYKPPVVPESKLFRKHLDKKPSVLLRDLTSFLSDDVDLSSLLHETSDVLKNTTNAHGVSLYLVESSTGEIHQSQRYFEIPEPRVRWKIEEGTIVAAHVASTKELVMIDDILQDLRFPIGIGQRDQLTKAVLCVPVLTVDGDCYAVIELFKDTSQEPFNEQDKEIATLVTGWMGAAIYQNIQRVAVQRKQELNDYLLGLTKVYLEEFVPMENMIVEMVKFVKVTLSAERSSFYLLDTDTTEDDDLIADIYEKGIDDTDDIEIYKNVKLSGREKELTINVAKTGTAVNIKDLFNDPQFGKGKEFDEKTGFIARSVLCAPVKRSHDIIAVLEVVNKKTGCFLKSDEILFDVFATYFSLVITFDNTLKEQNTKMKHNILTVDLLKRQIGPCVHDYNHFMKNLDIKLPNSFQEFKWTIQDEMVNEIPLFFLAMFKDLCHPEELNVPNLARFILAVRKFKCANMPFHDFERAFDFCHCLYVILKKNHELFGPLQVKALLIAGMCYCVGREGSSTNEFLMMSNSDIYQLFPTNSWQNYHSIIAIRLYEQFPIFKNLSNQEVKELLNEVKDNLILTDIQFHFYANSSSVARLMEKGSIDYEDPRVLRLVKSVILTCCLLTVYSKDYMVGRKILLKFKAEIYQEVSKIKQMKPDCILTEPMDFATDDQMPEQQLNILDNFILKIAKAMMDLLPNTEEYYNNVLHVERTWLDIIELRGRKIWRQEDSYIKKSILNR